MGNKQTIRRISMMKNNNQIVIIGGGMAGLTAAAYLTKENYNVLLLEKNSKCGGLVGTFSQNDFYFDSGPRAFVNSGMVKPMLNDLDINFESIDNTISIGVENEIIKVESMASLQDYKELLLKLYPSDSEDINNIIEKIEELSEYTRILYEFDNPNFVNLKNNYKYIFKKLIPWTFKFLNALRKMNQHETAMETYLKKFTNNQSLLDILTQFFFKKTPSHFALGYFYVYLDYFYPKGGTGTLVNLLYDKIVESGGKIELNKKIIKIDPKKSIVRDSNLNEYHYDYLIWAADLKTLDRIH
jgi:phytoene dehydrogenase-like protein